MRLHIARSTARSAVVVLAMFAALLPATSRAATLPVHDPLRILVVSDEVNPHGLPPAQLTQPGEISVALQAPGSGLNIDIVTEIATNDLDQATALLSVPINDPAAYDVVVYFAHRIPDAGAGGIAEQEQFVTALEAFLTAGGGVVSFHHGIYQTAGKQSVQELLGGVATGGVTWDTSTGQNVINVAPKHFITTNGIEYSGTASYADAAHGIAAGNYTMFPNVPDERYPNFVLHPNAGQITHLFASDYNENGTTHILGFTHRQPGWAGVVVAYQPGEYQPAALDDLQGNNFQILANAIYFAANQGAVKVPAVRPAMLGALTLVLSACAAMFAAQCTRRS